MSDSYDICAVRLNSLVNGLKQKQEVLQNYNNIIKDQLKNNIKEPADPLESCEVGQVHYLPHHCVMREESSCTMLRIVFNASVKANTKNPSLNDCLHIEPPLCPTILDTCFASDKRELLLLVILSMLFLNININAADRNFLRFLWLNSIEEENPSVVVYRSRTLTFGVGPCPFLMNATLSHHLDKYAEEEPELLET